MAEKLDLFELSIKKGLENAEEAWNESDWNSLEKRLDGLQADSGSAAASGFFSHFTMAAAVLAGLAVFYINPVSDSSDSNQVSQNPTEHVIANDIAGDHHQNMNADDSTSPAVSTTESEDQELALANEKQMQEAEASDSKKAEAILSKKEQDRIIRINERLQKAAEAKAQAETDSNEERFTTRYVGKDFDLGAARTFSPNNDGVKEFFIPNTLREGDTFVMSISDDSGRLIYRTREVSKPWVGKDAAGKEVPVGHYSWEVILQKDNKKEIFKGVVRLER